MAIFSTHKGLLPGNNYLGDTDSTIVLTDSLKTPSTDYVDPKSIVDEVIWVVGDEAILKSEVEALKAQSEVEGYKWEGNPDYRIPEQIALQKLFLTQAAIDSIEVTESEISRGIDAQINMWIQMVGSREKLEEYKGQTINQMKRSLHDDFKNRELENREREELVKDIKVTPTDVRKFYESVANQDSLPDVPTTVEVQIITRQPRIKNEEINRVKDQLRNFTERVTTGETSFAVLARLYSEDPGSARDGGELDYSGRGMLDPAFASVAFNLSDPKKISKIVESEFGYHIIQLIDKRGDKVKCRHILLKPKVDQVEIDSAKFRLDSLAVDIRNGKITFDEAATYLSDDKDSKSAYGLMSQQTQDGRTSRFRMQDLPTEIAAAVEKLNVGEVSTAFQMINSRGKNVVAIIKLKSRVDAHKANIREDFNVLKDVVMAKAKEEFLDNWIKEKIKTTYTRLNDNYKNGDYKYEGWVK
ncbi:MAG: peptidylprolyl isomerase [Bacteroidaceae bacterium]|nr:peptidylprolyl isomerase [Bacteroidaceae bacterium]